MPRISPLPQAPVNCVRITQDETLQECQNNTGLLSGCPPYNMNLWKSKRTAVCEALYLKAYYHLAFPSGDALFYAVGNIDHLRGKETQPLFLAVCRFRRHALYAACLASGLSVTAFAAALGKHQGRMSGVITAVADERDEDHVLDRRLDLLHGILLGSSEGVNEFFGGVLCEGRG